MELRTISLPGLIKKVGYSGYKLGYGGIRTELYRFYKTRRKTQASYYLLKPIIINILYIKKSSYSNRKDVLDFYHALFAAINVARNEAVQDLLLKHLMVLNLDVSKPEHFDSNVLKVKTLYKNLKILYDSIHASSLKFHELLEAYLKISSMYIDKYNDVTLLVDNASRHRQVNELDVVFKSINIKAKANSLFHNQYANELYNTGKRGIGFVTILLFVLTIIICFLILFLDINNFIILAVGAVFGGVTLTFGVITRLLYSKTSRLAKRLQKSIYRDYWDRTKVDYNIHEIINELVAYAEDILRIN